MKLATLLRAYLLFLAILHLPFSAESRSHLHSAETLKRIRFYVHDVIAGPNPTVWKVAGSNSSDTYPTHFGWVLVTDTPIRSGPEGKSKYLGQIQGIIAYTDQKKSAITVNVNVDFSEGEFKGSSLVLEGKNSLTEAVREVPVVGGKGALRLARGYVVTKTHSISKDGSRGVYQYDAVVLLPKIARLI